MLAVIISGSQKGYASHVIIIQNITREYCKLNAILRRYYRITSIGGKLGETKFLNGRSREAQSK